MLKINSEKGSATFILFAFIGIVVAGSLFFAAFITSQKASTPHPKSNLRLVAPSFKPIVEDIPIINLPTPVPIQPSPTPENIEVPLPSP